MSPHKWPWVLQQPFECQARRRILLLSKCEGGMRDNVVVIEQAKQQANCEPILRATECVHDHLSGDAQFPVYGDCSQFLKHLVVGHNGQRVPYHPSDHRVGDEWKLAELFGYSYAPSVWRLRARTNPSLRVSRSFPAGIRASRFESHSSRTDIAGLYRSLEFTKSQTLYA